MPLSRDTFQKLIDLFTPHFETLDQRRTLVGGAFFGTDVLAKVQLEGTADEFTTRTIQTLIQHGEVESGTPAIIRLMQQLRGTVGVDKQAEVDALIDTIRYELEANPAKPAGKPRVFISYSRADGEDFATDLRKRLEAEGLTLWQDRARMEGGVGWWKQITDALDAVEFMVLVATPAAIASAVVKKEWRYARQQGVCVYPVFGQKEDGTYYQMQDINTEEHPLPKSMHDSHFYNLDKEWETFVNYLKAPCTVPKVPFMAPDLPEHFVPRPEKFDALKAQLLDADFDNPVAITTALKGAGGFGKTTLAAALCHDEDIQTAFDEGVLWVTLGENPNIINKLTVLYRALTDENPGFIEIEEGANKLAEKLVDADVLLVIDDVWNPAHLRPFLRGGERVARLVTTRFSNIAVDANADLLEVDEMTADESVKMLLAGIEPPGDLTPFKALAERLGEWALMLEVTNGTLRKRMAKGADLTAALAYVNKALDKRGVAGLKTGSNEAAVQVLDTSIEQIDAIEQPRLFELSIFAEDTDVPLTSIMALWDMDDFDTEELIDQFDDLSFVRFDAERGTIRLHDVVREVLASRLKYPTVVHARLIDAYGDLTQLPDDYAWRNIGYHLMAVEQTETLHGLLLDYRYLQAKLDATDTNALIADCDYLAEDDAIRLVKSTLSMSAHVLSEHKDQLPYQLTGRLWTHCDQPDIAPLWEQAQASGKLELLGDKDYPPLMQAGGMLLRTLRGHDGRVTGALQLEDGRILSWSDDKTFRLWSPEGEMLVILDGHELGGIVGGIGGALELEDGRILAWAEYNGMPQWWTSQGEALSIPYDHVPWIRGVLKLNDRRLLLWAWSDYALRLWSPNGELLTVLEGHTDWINGALELVDGRILSWGQGEKILRLWSPSGEALAVLEGHTDMIEGALALTDGRLLSWSDDKTLRLWSTEGEPLAVLEGHGGKVEGALELADGRIFSWSNDARLWSPAGKFLGVLKGYRQNSKILELADGQLLSWKYSDSSPQLWTSQGEPLAELKGHIYEINGALALEDGRILSWGNDKTLRLWSSAGEPLAVLRGHTGRRVEDALALADGRILSWSDDKTLRLWSLQNDPLAVLEAHDDEVKDVLALKGGQLLSWSYDKTLRLWSMDGELLTILQGHTSLVYGALELADGRILSWSTDKTLRLWSSTGDILAVLEGHNDDVTGSLELADGRILSWSDDKTLQLWSSAGEPLAKLKGHTYKVGGALELEDGRILSWPMKKGHANHSGDYDVTLRLWSPAGEPLAVLEGHTYSVEGAQVLANGRVLSRSGGSRLRLWLSTGEPLAVLEGHPYLKTRGALELEDGRILSWSEDKTLRLWSSDGEPLVVLEGHTDSVEGALVLADGRILSWSKDKTLRLWSSAGEPLAVLEQDEEVLVMWAQEHGFDVRVLYEGDAHNPDSIFVRRVGARLWVHNVGQFIGDAELKALAVRGHTVVVGDEAGRVIFLRVRTGDEFINIGHVQ